MTVQPTLWLGNDKIWTRQINNSCSYPTVNHLSRDRAPSNSKFRRCNRKNLLIWEPFAKFIVRGISFPRKGCASRTGTRRVSSSKVSETLMTPVSNLKWIRMVMNCTSKEASKRPYTPVTKSKINRRTSSMHRMTTSICGPTIFKYFRVERISSYRTSPLGETVYGFRLIAGRAVTRWCRASRIRFS